MNSQGKESEKRINRNQISPGTKRKRFFALGSRGVSKHYETLESLWRFFSNINSRHQLTPYGAILLLKPREKLGTISMYVHTCKD